VVGVPALLAYAFRRRVWLVVGLGAVLAFANWATYWFGSTDTGDGELSRAETMAFGAILSSVLLVFWMGGAWAGHVLGRRRATARPSQDRAQFTDDP